MPIDGICLEKVLKLTPLGGDYIKYENQIKDSSAGESYIKTCKNLSRWVELVKNLYRLKTNGGCTAPSLLAGLIASGDEGKAYSVNNVHCNVDGNSFTIYVNKSAWNNDETIKQYESSISYWLDKVSKIPYKITKSLYRI